MEQCTAAMQNGYKRKQCSRKAKVGSLCTQHEKRRLADIIIEARMKTRWDALNDWSKLKSKE